MYQRAVDNIRASFRQIWQATDDLVFDVGETELRWEDSVVYNQEQRGESIAWTLYKDGVRSLAFKPGVEEAEIVNFLGVLQRARSLTADAADDLLTLLWAQDFQFVTYTFRELATENAVPIEAGDTITSVGLVLTGDTTTKVIKIAFNDAAPATCADVAPVYGVTSSYSCVVNQAVGTATKFALVAS